MQVLHNNFAFQVVILISRLDIRIKQKYQTVQQCSASTIKDNEKEVPRRILRPQLF